MSLPFSYPAQAVLLPVTSLIFGERTRTSYPNLQELADSISSGGLIHPPTVNLSNQLIAGGRRCRAMIDILKVTHIPVVYLETADEAHLRYLEDQENYQRSTPHWTDRIRGIHRIHTAKTIESRLEHSSKWTVKMTGELLNMSQANVSIALSLIPAILAADEEILSCPDLSSALRILVSRREKEVMATLTTKLPITTRPAPAPLTGSVSDQVSEQDIFGFGLAQRPADMDLPITLEGVSAANQPPIPIGLDEVEAAPDQVDWDQVVICADSIQWMHAHPECADHIVTDIPYGIDMGNLSQQNTGMDVSATAAEHTVEGNLELFGKLFPAMFTALKDKGYAVLFCDMQHWWALAQLAEEAGFKVQRWPLVWNKLHPCLNQAAQYNFTKNYEVALVARKGNATLVTPQSTSVLSYDNPDKSKLGHPFAKPINLWTVIYKAVTLQGQIVLDPFCGSGSASVAALRNGLVPLAIDIVLDHVNLAKSNLAAELA